MNKKKVLSESVLVVIYTIVGMLGTLLVLKILSSILSKAEFGEYSLLLSILAFITIFPFKAFDQANARYVSINRNENIFSEYYSNYLVFFIILVMLYSVLFFAVSVIDIDLGVFTDYLWVFFLFFVSEVSKITLRTIVGADRHRATLVVSSIIEFGLKVAILLFFSVQLSVYTVLWIFVFTNVIASINLSHKNYKAFHYYAINKKNFLFHNKRLWLFAAPFIIMATFTWARDMSNRWIIDYFLDKESVAVYSVLTSIVIIIPMGIQTVLGSYIVPIIYQKENTQKGFARKTTNWLLLLLPIIFLVSAIFVYIFSNGIIVLFSSNDYIYDSWALLYMFLAYSFYTLSMFSIYEIMSYKQSEKLVLPSVLSGILSLISGIVLIKYYGLDGAIFSYIVGYVSYALMIFWVVYKFRKTDDNN